MLRSVLRPALRLAVHSVFAIVLTLVTQIGGVAWLASRAFPRPLIAFVGVYGALLVLSWLAAPLFGRVPLPCFATAETPLKAQSVFYCATARNFATPRASEAAIELSRAVAAAHPGAVTQYLDAGFPFFDGFPLPPHLSHDDGRKLDFAFFYKDAAGAYAPGATRSPVGYWAFETPPRGAQDICARTSDRLTMRWDMAPLQALWPERPLDEARTRTMIAWLATEGRRFGVRRILLEPHLKARLGLRSEAIRFQGCRAARHDDHIHVDIE